MEEVEISMIAMLGENTRVIGKNNKLPWRIKKDMSRFTDMTEGNTVIMGRKTYESIPSKFRPLPRRHNIVVSRTLPPHDDYIIARSIEESLQIAETLGSPKIFFMGGEEIYRLAMPFVKVLHLTLVNDDKAEGDTFFPEYIDEFKPVDDGESHQEGDLFFKFITFKKTAT